MHTERVAGPTNPGSLSREQRDGRVARGNRTRRAIVEAHVQLLREGELRPTAATVAERAGVSVRTLWGAFGDMEGLFQATPAYWFEADDALRSTIDRSASLDVRIEQFCTERVRRLENISPAARAAFSMEPFSLALRQSRLAHVRRAADDVSAVFAPELAVAPDPDVLRDALVVATSWNAWSLLRDDLDHPLPAARAAMVRSVRSLLTPGR